MKKQDPIVIELLLVSAGELLATGLVFGIFALSGYWTRMVLWGGVLGCILSVAYYALTAAGVVIATKKATGQDTRGAKRTLRAFQFLRFALLLAVASAALISKRVNPIALVAPIFLFRPVLSMCELFRKSGDGNVC